jgi:hypothetical protein
LSLGSADGGGGELRVQLRLTSVSADLAEAAATMPAVMWVWFIPLYVLGALLVLFALVAVLGRFRGGRYLRPIVAALARAPLFGRFVRRASTAVLERQNPALASAIRKLDRMGAKHDPQRAQRALSSLTAAERRAYLEAAGEQDAMPAPQNRAERRRRARLR